MSLSLAAQDGRQIKVCCWEPEEEAQFAMVLSHGMAEHIERYERFALACNKAGIAVYGANHRGHGADAPKLGHYADKDGWSLVISDLDQIVETVKAKHNTKPVILFGHSMGSFVAQQYGILHGSKLDGLILCGSNFQKPFAYKAGRMITAIEKWRIGADKPSPLLDWLSFGSFNSKFKPNRTASDWLSRDNAEVDKYISDDYCGFPCTPQFWHDFLSGLIAISSPGAFTKIPSELPVFIISGDKDPVGQQGKGVLALKNHFISSGSQNVSCKLYDGGRHEILNETNADEVYGDVVSWVSSSL